MAVVLVCNMLYTLLSLILFVKHKLASIENILLYTLANFLKVYMPHHITKLRYIWNISIVNTCQAPLLPQGCHNS